MKYKCSACKKIIVRDERIKYFKDKRVIMSYCEIKNRKARMYVV
jgi:hypothetical protein